VLPAEAADNLIDPVVEFVTVVGRPSADGRDRAFSVRGGLPGKLPHSAAALVSSLVTSAGEIPSETTAQSRAWRQISGKTSDANAGLATNCSSVIAMASLITSVTGSPKRSIHTRSPSGSRIVVRSSWLAPSLVSLPVPTARMWEALRRIRPGELPTFSTTFTSKIAFFHGIRPRG